MIKSGEHRPAVMLDLEYIAKKKLHHRDGMFMNPFSDEPFHRRSFGQILRWKFLTPNPYKELYEKEETRPVRIDWQRLPRSASTSLTWINHASVLVSHGESRILVDPVFFGLFWPIKDFSPLDFKVSDMPAIDAVLITHGHYDHLDIDTLKALRSRVKLFVVPLGHSALLRRNGIDRVVELDWFDSLAVGSFTVTFLPASHWTMRSPIEGPNRALWGSYLVRSASLKTIYITGDTAYFDGFGQIAKLARVDLAVVNLGAYEPRWFMKRSHMDPVEAVQAFKDLGAKKLVAVHWGTFRLGDEPVFLPGQDIAREMERAGMSHRLVRLGHGETYVIE